MAEGCANALTKCVQLCEWNWQQLRKRRIVPVRVSTAKYGQIVVDATWLYVKEGGNGKSDDMVSIEWVVSVRNVSFYDHYAK
jgi:hypothetical protein